MKRLLILLVIVGVIIVFSPAAYSASAATGSLEVEANVLQTCHVRTVPVVFINYKNSNMTRFGQVQVICTDGTGYAIHLDGGDHLAQRGPARNMYSTKTTEYLMYSLLDPGDSLWGDDSGGVYGDEYEAIGDGSWDLWPVKGILPGLQNVGEGRYTDTVGVRIEFD